MTKKPLVVGITLMLLITLATYYNHFNNSFHFDDFHTIVNNANIRSLKNIPRFFTDGSTMSVLPQNQAYRPVTVTSLAIDYWIAGDNYASYFQASTFILFLLQGVLMIFLFLKVFNLSVSNSRNVFIALFAACWYMVHPANAETINYIIARADVQSTLFVLLAFVLYIYSSFCRKTYLYLLAVGIGALCKPPTVMFAPLLFCYVLFFGEQLGVTDLFKKTHRTEILSVVKKTLPSFIFCAFMYLLIDRLTPKTWEPGGTAPLQYLITQPFVILHYFCEFFLPTSLSADSDWKLLPSIWDIRFFSGCFFILLMLITAVYTSKKQILRPISFGIAWFFIALAPTSSIVPLGEVLNDHRMFFPFIGLVISVSWAIGLILTKYAAIIKKPAIITPGILLIFGYAYGTYQRNKVWHTEESLWKDVTIKSPDNGRGLMNYAMVKSEQGDYNEAEIYLKKALKITPGYSFLYTNLGVVKEEQGDLKQAEYYYQMGAGLGGNYPDPLRFYARFLIRQRRYKDAIPFLHEAMRISPNYIAPRTQLMTVYSMLGEWDKLKQLATQTLQFSPGNPDVLSYLEAANRKTNELDIEAEKLKGDTSAAKYMDISLLDYQAGRYPQCISTAGEAIKLKPKLAEAYNNIGASYIKLKQYKQAIAAIKQALLLKPGFLFAKNNLDEAEQDIADTGVKVDYLSAADYLTLSLDYFNSGMYSECIKACNYALILDPKYHLAYNNICAADNKLSKWDDAIAAAKKGLQINPNSRLLKNNMAAAIKAKNQVWGK
jgi:tetratricopeptide (TPR) repeat protein